MFTINKISVDLSIKLEVKNQMTIKIKNQITKDEELKIDLLQIRVETPYPSTPIKIKLDDGTQFGSNTDKEGIAICHTSNIKNYNITVEIADKTVKDKIKIE